MKVAVIGVGNLGGAIVGKLRENGVEVLEVRRGEMENAKGSDVYIVALKPDVFRENFEVIGEIAEEKPVISFAAGVKIKEMEGYIRNPFRAMSNIQLSLVACYPDCSEILSIFNSEIMVCEREEEIDVLTAYLGSSPAIISYLIHSFILAAVKDGIKYDKAVKIAASVFKDSSDLYNSYGLEGVVRRIATPSGTTIEGINTLIANNGLEAFMDALLTTARKSRDL